MTVPKASIDLDDGLIARKHEIGLARKIFDVQAVSETPRMQTLPYQELRFGVLAPNPRHHLTSFFLLTGVSQAKAPLYKSFTNYARIYSVRTKCFY